MAVSHLTCSNQEKYKTVCTGKYDFTAESKSQVPPTNKAFKTDEHTDSYNENLIRISKWLELSLQYRKRQNTGYIRQ